MALTPRNATGIVPAYKTNNKSVAAVDKFGKITAVKKGKATVTVKAGGKSAKMVVTVK